MAQEADLLKAIMQTKKGRALNKLVNTSTRFESLKGLSKIAEHPELNHKIGKYGLKGLQTALQIYFFTRGGGALINKMSSVPRLIKGALPFYLSALGTVGTQFGIEKLDHKSYKKALDQALIDGATDLTFSIGGLGMKELFLNQLNKVPSSKNFNKKFEKAEEDIIEAYWPYAKTLLAQAASYTGKQTYKKISEVFEKQKKEKNDLNYTSQHLKNDIIKMKNQEVQLKRIEYLIKKLKPMNNTKGKKDE